MDNIQDVSKENSYVKKWSKNIPFVEKMFENYENILLRNLFVKNNIHPVIHETHSF